MPLRVRMVGIVAGMNYGSSPLRPFLCYNCLAVFEFFPKERLLAEAVVAKLEAAQRSHFHHHSANVVFFPSSCNSVRPSVLCFCWCFKSPIFPHSQSVFTSTISYSSFLAIKRYQTYPISPPSTYSICRGQTQKLRCPNVKKILHIFPPKKLFQCEKLPNFQAHQ